MAASRSQGPPPAAALVLLLAACGGQDEQVLNSIPAPVFELADGFTGSTACAACHPEIFDRWQGSHHRWAERDLDAEKESLAFLSPIATDGGVGDAYAEYSQDEYRIHARGPQDTEQLGSYPAERVIGVDPLQQYLLPGEGGRLQVSALSFDVHRSEWFDVFGGDGRRPEEWGHWSNRGMAWNAQCADCHNTNLIKGYERESDRYTTRASEMGVGCEACHGPGAEHAATQGQAGLSMGVGLEAPLAVDACGRCHSRRVELTEEYRVGEPLLDAFHPELPNLTEVYFADGQVQDEDYEYTSFLTSRMYANGVVCTNCHDPHTAELLLPGNQLCMSCHAGKPGYSLEPIDPATHSHHDPQGAGGQCVNCHMPLTTYMQRHPRRDHGFTIPDPGMTIELGIPNACNRCHTARDAAWAAEASESWWGSLEDHRSRLRTRLVARARQGDSAVLPELMHFATNEPRPVWRAIAAGLLGSGAQDPLVREVLGVLTRDEAALVRAEAARALVASGPEGQALLEPLLEDEVRSVRIWAASSLGPALEMTTRAAGELQGVFDMNADQPGGLMWEAGFWLSRGSTDRAVELLEKALAWGGASPPLHHSLAVALSKAGRLAEAVRVCQSACDQNPDNATSWHDLGLAHSAAGQAAQAQEALERATELDPDYTRAWYNLGLLRNAAADVDGAEQALRRCTALEPLNPDTWVVLAMVLRDGQRVDEARKAAEHALTLAPQHSQALSLLESLE